MPRLTDEQLSARRLGIGASEIAAIAGCDFRRTPWDLWLEKRGLAPASEQDEWAIEAQEIGHELEDWLANWYVRKFGVSLLPGGTIYCADTPHYFATIDRKIVGEPAALEIKIVGGRMMHRYDATSTDGVPDDVRCQVQWQMMCGEYRYAPLAVNLGGTQRRAFRVERDDGLIAKLRGAAEPFWASVQSGTEPKLDASDACRSYLEAKYPRDTRPRRESDLDDELIADRRISAAISSKQAALELQLADTELIARCGEDGGIKGDGWTFSYRIAKKSVTGERKHRFTVLKNHPSKMSLALAMATEDGADDGE